MNIIETPLNDVLVIQPQVFSDDRGYFLESWQQQKFDNAGLNLGFLQDNESCSSKGTLRGIHLQIKHPQGKLVRVVKGSVFDVAVDLRPESSTCGQWFGKVLDSNNKEMMWIPPGFGHAFYTLSDEAIFVYKCTEIYFHDDQYTLAWDDPDINIDWPTELANNIALSEKDRTGMSYAETMSMIRKNHS